MFDRCFSLSQEVQCLSDVLVMRTVANPFLSLLVKFQLVVNGDTKKSEIFTDWYCCIFSHNRPLASKFVSCSCPWLDILSDSV